MSALSAIIDYIKDNNITVPQYMTGVAYGAQLISRQFFEENQKYLKGIHFVSVHLFVFINIPLGTNFFKCSTRSIL